MFTVQSLPAHSDFISSSSIEMNALSAGTDDIIPDGGHIMGAVTSLTINSASYSNISVTYSSVSYIISDVNYQTDDLSTSVFENIISQLNPELPCSVVGTTSIFFSIANYPTSAVPSWISIDPSTGALSFTTPEVDSDTEYNFYIDSAIGGVSDPIHKLIKLTVLNCIPSNWVKCTSTSISIWEICSSDYNLSSGEWVSQNSSKVDSITSKVASEIAQALTTTITSLFGTIAGIIVLTGLLNTSSIANLWMTVNQLQLFFLLELTRVYLPNDVQATIEGSEFALNIFKYFQLKNLNISSYLLRNFKFELSNKLLEPLGINYDSIIVNIYSIIVFTFIMIILSILIFPLKKLLFRFKDNRRWPCLIKTLYWIVDKIYRMLVLSYFIRNALEMSQFVLISAIYEVYQHNTSNVYRVISSIFSILVISLYVLMIFLIFYLTLSSYRPIEKEHNKVEEFFRGIKLSIKHRSYVTVLIIRRITFIVLLVVCTSISSIVLIIIMVIIQIVYLIYLSWVRPYIEIKGNFIEIMNEIYFFFLLSFLIFVNTKNDWNSIKTSLYMWVLVSNVIAVFVIIAGT